MSSNRRIIFALGVVIVGVGVAVAWQATTDARACAAAREQYDKWGYYAALTDAPEAFEKLRMYRAQVEACEVVRQ